MPLAGDVKDATRLLEIFLTRTSLLIFHAAAYKHVTLKVFAHEEFV